MRRFESTAIWQRTLATQLDPDSESLNRSRLRTAYESLRDRAGILAGEIAKDLPDFTVHDITHLDALWEMAQLVAGSDFPITPAEAFVLGGAILIHDLGMGIAAYPEGVSELRKASIWHDTVAALLREQVGRTPTAAELVTPPKDIESQAIRVVLREMHARHADRLALISWRDHNNPSSDYFLIDDPVLRATYGPVIGKIAHSHWWPVDQLMERLPKELGALGGFENRWTVDPVKLACLLRVADASHLDDRRAPGFLRALRSPSGVSGHHWLFQEKLYQPRLESDRLIYTSKGAFSEHEAGAWWACFDALRTVDKELRHVDSLLADTRRPRLSARGVAYTEDPPRMAKLIEADGWKPIDVRIQVGNVARLIATLGGEKLYGQEPTVPLRELIQNAADAVIARRLLEERRANWGEVTVRHGTDHHGKWIEVEDSGIGMSANVLTGPFLDFGTSFWGSGLMHQELQGLEAKGFTSTGRFGIGFFSVFMWGERVRIITRRPEKARESTLVLEFNKGLLTRPLLREARPEEQIMDGGTRVRVWFDKDRTFDEILRGPHRGRQWRRWTLDQRCAWLCPTLNVDLRIESAGSIRKVVSASDWLSLKAPSLMRRITGPRTQEEQNEIKALFPNFELRLREIKSDAGETIGRACIVPWLTTRQRDVTEDLSLDGVVSVGGFRSCYTTGIFGILLGEPHTAARSIGVPFSKGASLARWASEQAVLLRGALPDPEQEAEAAHIIRFLGGDVDQLVFAESREGWLNTSQVLKLVERMDEVLIFHDATLSLERDKGPLVLFENVIAVPSGWPGVLQTGRTDTSIDWPHYTRGSQRKWLTRNNVRVAWDVFKASLHGLAITTVAQAWGISLEDLVMEMDEDSDEVKLERNIGLRDMKPITKTVMSVLRRPMGTNRAKGSL